MQVPFIFALRIPSVRTPAHEAHRSSASRMACRRPKVKIALCCRANCCPAVQAIQPQSASLSFVESSVTSILTSPADTVEVSAWPIDGDLAVPASLRELNRIQLACRWALRPPTMAMAGEASEIVKVGRWTLYGCKILKPSGGSVSERGAQLQSGDVTGWPSGSKVIPGRATCLLFLVQTLATFPRRCIAVPNFNLLRRRYNAAERLSQ